MDKNIQSLKTFFTEALERYKKKDFKTTEVFCYKILSIDRNHFDSLSLLANIFAINRNFDKAKEFLEKAIRIEPKNLTILNLSIKMNLKLYNNTIILYNTYLCNNSIP